MIRLRSLDLLLNVLGPLTHDDIGDGPCLIHIFSIATTHFELRETWRRMPPTLNVAPSPERDWKEPQDRLPKSTRGCLMQTRTLREILASFLNKFAEPETLAPFLAVSLYQALLRKRLPAGMSERVAEAAFKRCRELEKLYRVCEVPCPELWAKDSLHLNVARAAPGC